MNFVRIMLFYGLGISRHHISRSSNALRWWRCPFWSKEAKPRFCLRKVLMSCCKDGLKFNHCMLFVA